MKYIIRPSFNWSRWLFPKMVCLLFIFYGADAQSFTLCSALTFIWSRGTQFTAEINKTKRKTYEPLLPILSWSIGLATSFYFTGNELGTTPDLVSRKVIPYCASTNIPVFTDFGKSCSCMTTIQLAWSHLFLCHNLKCFPTPPFSAR